MNNSKQMVISVDQYMLGYAQLKHGRAEEARKLLQHTSQWAHKEQEQLLLPSLAGWLWLLGEYTVKTKDKTIYEQSKQLVNNLIIRIADTWQLPERHWIYPHKEGRFLSQLGLYYAALRSATFLQLSDLALKTSKEMRDQLFTQFMNNIGMVSEQATQNVDADIVLATVPFGFFTPGDLALLKGLEKVDVTALSGKEAAFFSMYYTESGQQVKAKQLISQALNNNTAGEVNWIAAAEHMIQLHEEAAQLSFDHSPLGEECPYFKGSNERSPRVVLDQSQVHVKVIIKGAKQLQHVLMSYQLNESSLKEVELDSAVNENGELYWEGIIPSSAKYSHIRYFFSALDEDGITTQSNDYSYEVLAWESLELRYASHTEKALYYSISGHSHWCVLQERDNSSAGTQYSLSIIDELADQLEDLEAIVDGKRKSEVPSFQLLMNGAGKLIKAKLVFEIEPSSEWYGMGERFSTVAFSNCEIDHYVYNQYKDQGHRTYIPVPLAIGPHGFGLYLESSLYSIFRIGTVKSDLLEIEADVDKTCNQLSWYHLAGSPLEQLSQYTAITGRPKLPPKWAFGPWMSSNNWDSDSETRYQLAQNKKYDIPATVMVLEQWSDEATFYIFNDAQYKSKAGSDRFSYDDFHFPSWGRWPDPKGLIEKIHQDGIKLLLWQAPVMKYMEGLAHIQHDVDEEFMLANDYMVKRADGSAYRIPSFEWFRGSLVPDFTSEQAAEWWLSKRKYLLDEIGIDGFKTDGGECIYGSDLQFADGRDGATMRNEYPNTYIGAFHEYANRFVEGGAITFSRSGYAGAQNVPMHWAGDEKSTFEAFRSSVIAGLSSGLSGIPFWGWDFGGFSGEIPTAELYIRSTQMAAFCPVMQYHAESKGQFNMDRTPWNIAERTGTPEVLSIYKKFADLRMNLLPYIYEQAQISSVTGEPLMRALLLDYPTDPYASRIETEYMFGKALLVAPVLEEGERKVDVYFPQGKWLSFFDSLEEPIQGGQHLPIRAELEHIPVYIRENHVIPVNVDDGLQLASHVGNQVDEYKELVFITYVTSQVDYSYSDDMKLSIQLHIEADGDGRLLKAKVAGSHCPVVWLKQAAQATTFMCNEVAMKEVQVEEQLRINCFMRRGNDVLVRLSQGSQVIAW